MPLLSTQSMRLYLFLLWLINMLNIKNLAPTDLEEMLATSSPDEVYSFVASNLKSPNETRSLKLQLIAKQIKTITSRAPLLSLSI